MANIDFRLSDRARAELRALLDPVLAESAERVAAACNRQSSWGGYHAYAETGRAGVVTESRSASIDNARSQRLLTNLEAGRL